MDFFGYLTLRGPSEHTSLELSVLLFWNTHPGAVTILAEKAETEDVQEGAVPTMEHLAVF